MDPVHLGRPEVVAAERAHPGAARGHGARDIKGRIGFELAPHQGEFGDERRAGDAGFERPQPAGGVRRVRARGAGWCQPQLRQALAQRCQGDPFARPRRHRGQERVGERAGGLDLRPAVGAGALDGACIHLRIAGPGFLPAAGEECLAGVGDDGKRRCRRAGRNLCRGRGRNGTARRTGIGHRRAGGGGCAAAAVGRGQQEAARGGIPAQFVAAAEGAAACGTGAGDLQAGRPPVEHPEAEQAVGEDELGAAGAIGDIEFDAGAPVLPEQRRAAGAGEIPFRHQEIHAPVAGEIARDDELALAGHRPQRAAGSRAGSDELVHPRLHDLRHWRDLRCRR